MKPRAVCILGMHRSGTSSVIRSINFLGAYIGKEEAMVEPGYDNPSGFWELKEIVSIHKRIMVILNRGCDEIVAPLPRGWHLRKEMLLFKEDIRNLIRTSFRGHDLWAWKDPRTCLTLDLWKALLEEEDIKLLVVFVVRHPFDVANSLKKRNGYSMAESLGIWFNHNVSALMSISNLPAVFLSYDSFLERPLAELNRCSALLGIPWPSNIESLQKEVNSFVRSDFRHNMTEADSTKLLPVPVRELYNLLLEQLHELVVPDKSFFEKVKELYDEFYQYASFFYPDLYSMN